MSDSGIGIMEEDFETGLHYPSYSIRGAGVNHNFM